MTSTGPDEGASGETRLNQDDRPRSVSRDAAPHSVRRLVLLEIAVVLSFAVLPDLFTAVAAQATGKSFEMGFVATNAYMVVRSVAVACPLLYIMGMSGTSWSTFGIRQFRSLRDPGAGVVVWLAEMFFWLWMVRILRVDQCVAAVDESDAAYAGMVISGAGDFAILLVALVFNSFAEELAMRAYLVPRLEQVFASTLAAVIGSSAIFASYHVYQGAYGVIGALLTGLVFGVAFVILRRIWPLVVAHTLINLYIAAQVSFAAE